MKRKGIAIPIVIVLAAILGLISTFVVKGIRQYSQSNQTSYAQLQAYFIARAGVEHAMLKTKLLHRELYDAICLSQGRNPIFDYSLLNGTTENKLTEAIESYNPGPIFLYPQNKCSDRTGVYTKDFTDAQEPNRNLWLDYFMSDLTTNPNNTSINPTLNFSNLSSDIKSKMIQPPFKMAQYKVSKLNIAAEKIEENASNNIIVEMIIDSELLTAREESWSFQIKKTINISRD